MQLVPELLIRQVLVEQLALLAADRRRMDELFERADDLLQGSQDRWQAEMRRVLEAMARPGARAVTFNVGYPGGDSRLPWVSIITDAGSEDEGGAVMGDLLGTQYERIGTAGASDERIYANDHLGIEWTANIQVGAWCTSGERATVLHNALKACLVAGKGQLLDAGVRECSMSESGFAPNPDMGPRMTAYVPINVLRIAYTLRQTRRRGPVPHTMTLRAPTFTNDDLG